MSRLTESVHSIYRFLWNPNPERSPAQSGVYLTRNDRNQDWFRYFDARLGHWYMSWAEMQTQVARGSSRISDADMASEVVAWAQRTRMVRA